MLPCELISDELKEGGQLSSKSSSKKQPLRTKKVRKIKRVAPATDSELANTIDESVKTTSKVTKKRFVAHVESVSFGLPPTLQRGM